MPIDMRLLHVIANTAAARGRRVLRDIAIETATVLAETDPASRAAALAMAERPPATRRRSQAEQPVTSPRTVALALLHGAPAAPRTNRSQPHLNPLDETSAAISGRLK
jgi:hypothetical protein